MSEITTDSLKKIKISVGTIIILIPFFLYGLHSVNTIDDNSTGINKLDNRVLILEQSELSNHDLLLELKFNLKKFMEASGEKYISLSRNK